MGKLSGISAREAVKAFTKAGFFKVSQVGSHIKMRRQLPDGKIETIIIPDHKQIKEGTLRKGILRPIGMTPDEFILFLKN